LIGNWEEREEDDGEMEVSPNAAAAGNIFFVARVASAKGGTGDLEQSHEGGEGGEEPQGKISAAEVLDEPNHERPAKQGHKSGRKGDVEVGESQGIESFEP
jgi:hypothetical protein